MNVLHLCVLLFAVISLGAATTPRPHPHVCKWCVDNAKCVNGRSCECEHGYVGNGFFLCHKKEKHDVCTLCDDPWVDPVSDEPIKVPYLGNTLMWDRTVERPDKHGWNCRSRVAVTNIRRPTSGRFYPRCVIIKLNFYRKNPDQKCLSAYKVCGYAWGNFMKWTIAKGEVKPGTTGDISYTIFQNITADGATHPCTPESCDCAVDFSLGKGKILIVKAACCSLKLGFRPFVSRTSWRKSGVWIVSPKVPATPFTLPVKLAGFPICLKPGATIERLRARMRLSKPWYVMSFIALTNLKPNWPKALFPGQLNLVHKLWNCDPIWRNKFFSMAGFMLTNRPFIKCIGDNKWGFYRNLQVTALAVDFYCTRKQASCDGALKIIKERCEGLLHRPDDFPQLHNFVTNKCPKS